MTSSSLSAGVIDALAASLHEAARKAQPVPPLTEAHPELSISDAYAVQLRGRAMRKADGATLVGRKIGLTSAAMQEMLGVDQPDFGYLTADMVDPSGAILSCSDLGLIAPRIEGEIAFRLDRPLQGPGITIDDVLAATAEVAPALEIIDSRVSDWRIKIADTIADNASSARVVFGEFRPLGELDLAAIAMHLVVVDADGGEEAVQGRGDAVLGHPAKPVAWLAAALAEYGDEHVAAGELVIPGALGRALPVAPGSSVRATFGPLGEVTVAFEEA
jgi:2-keto-4-pentenoate hydratase